MAITEESRHRLYQRLEELLGREQATTLMEHLPPVGWADVATKRDLDSLRRELDLRFDAIDQRFDTIEHRFESIDHRFDAIDHRFESIDHRFESIDQRFGIVATKADLQREIRLGFATAIVANTTVVGLVVAALGAL